MSELWKQIKKKGDVWKHDYNLHVILKGYENYDMTIHILMG